MKSPRHSRTTRAAMAALVVVALGLGVTACTGSDNGGVITPPPNATTTTTTGAPAATTTTALPGGTLPSS